MSLLSLQQQHGPKTLREHLQFQRRRLRAGLTGVNPRRLMFITCFPKSGSTYLMSVLHLITGFKRVFPITGASERGGIGSVNQDFCDRELHRIRYQDGVCHQHLCATDRNVSLAKKHQIRPAILVRNIYDVVPSIADHWRRETKVFQTGFVPSEYDSWSQFEQLDFISRLHIPWYFHYLLAWHEAQNQLPVFWLTYERLFNDQVNVLRELCEFWNYPVTDTAILSAIDQVKNYNTRRNQAVSGRGRLLDGRHRETLQALADSCHLPGLLRQRIGLVEAEPPVCEKGRSPILAA